MLACPCSRDRFISPCSILSPHAYTLIARLSSCSSRWVQRRAGLAADCKRLVHSDQDEFAHAAPAGEPMPAWDAPIHQRMSSSLSCHSPEMAAEFLLQVAAERRRDASAGASSTAADLAAAPGTAGGYQIHWPRAAYPPARSVLTLSRSLARCSVRSAMPTTLAASRSVRAGCGPAARCCIKKALASSSRRSRSAALMRWLGSLAFVLLRARRQPRLAA